MRFTHTADCHIGGHRDVRLRALTERAFEQFITETLQDNVDFTLIAGDLFNTALPGIDSLKFSVEQLRRLKNAGIPVYAIPGSHDYSPSGKTMLDVLEKAGLLTNVFKGEIHNGKLLLQFTTDKKTGVKLTGILGKRGMLDRELYDDLDRSIEQEPGEKIFLFHTALDELAQGVTPAHQDVHSLPKGFLYYAGGHVHVVERYHDAEHNLIVYPGPLFPNSFSELEELGSGGYCAYNNGKVERKAIKLVPVVKLHIIATEKSGAEANTMLQEAAAQEAVENAIVLIRIEGTLAAGSPADVDLAGVTRTLEARGAYAVLRNASRLTGKEFEALATRHDEQHDIEAHLLEEHKEQLTTPHHEGVALARTLMQTLGQEPNDGEKTYEYQDRILKEALQILEKKQ